MSSFKLENTIWALFTKPSEKKQKNARKDIKHKLIVGLETKDSQIDFNEIRLQHEIGSEAFTYKLFQQNDLQDRPVRQDTISKFCYKIDVNNTLYGLALRQSFFFDIYWDMFLVPQQSRCKIEGLIFTDSFRSGGGYRDE